MIAHENSRQALCLRLVVDAYAAAKCHVDNEGAGSKCHAQLDAMLKEMDDSSSDSSKMSSGSRTGSDYCVGPVSGLTMEEAIMAAADDVSEYLLTHVMPMLLLLLLPQQRSMQLYCFDSHHNVLTHLIVPSHLCLSQAIKAVVEARDRLLCEAAGREEKEVAAGQKGGEGGPSPGEDIVAHVTPPCHEATPAAAGNTEKVNGRGGRNHEGMMVVVQSESKQLSPSPSSSSLSLHQPLVNPVGVVGNLGPNSITPPFHLPFQVAVDDSCLYVADCGKHCLVVLDKHSLKELRVIGGRNTSEHLLLHQPVGVAVDGSHVYVVENGWHMVIALDKMTGKEEWRVGGGGESGQTFWGRLQQPLLRHPHHVVVDDKHVYVADAYDGQVVVLRKDTGEHVRTLHVLSGFKYIFNHNHRSNLPHGLALDPDKPNHLYISYGNNILVVNKVTAAPIRTFCTALDAGGKGSLPQPYALAIQGRYLYIADYRHGLVQVVDKNNGVHLGTPADNTGFSSPTGLAIDDQHLYVCDYGHHRVKIFSA